MQIVDVVTLNVWWNRVISIVDEVAGAFYRTAFSGGVRESQDYSCTLLDSRGELIAQSTRSIPSFIGTVPITVKHFLKVFPHETLNPDDVIITNDPWIASGHLPDLTLALPIFYGGKVVGFFGIVFHMADIGGRSGAADATDPFEEGLKIPTVQLYSKGTINKAVAEFITNNVRVPEEVMGDIEAAITAAKTGEGRVIDFMTEYSLTELSLLGTSVQDISERAMREAIKKIPPGVYSNSVALDGWDHPLTIRVSISIKDDEMVVDYSGTSPQVGRAINSVYNYTYAFTIYAIKSAICPFVPNNAGSCRPIRVVVPDGSLMNPKAPVPVSARHLTGHFIQAAVLGALAKVIPEKVSAESSAPFWGLIVHGQRENGEIYVAQNVIYNGGQGANAFADGISCLCIPSNCGSPPIEITETTTGLMIKEKEFVADSGGPGKFRGGLGQRVTIESVSPFPTKCYLMTDRIKNAARGYMGGKSGTAGALFKGNVPIDVPKGEITLNQGESVTLILPGGGGYGDPKLRERERIKTDLLNGLVTLDRAKKDYYFSP
jgi:N-methylhydantoinase B